MATSFESLVRAASNDLLSKVSKKCNEIAWDLFTNIVSKTPSPANPGPYAKGLLANQWYVQENLASSALGSGTSPNGASSLSRINAIKNSSAFLNKDGRLILSNNVPYAGMAESTGWNPPRWAGTPPYRMVALSLQEAAAKYKSVSLK